MCPKNHPVLLAEAPLTPKADREKTTEIMFETFEVPVLNIANQGSLSVYTESYTTGFAVECGEEFSRVIPVYNGFPLHPAIECMEVGGMHLTNFMEKMFIERHGSCKASLEVIQYVFFF